MLRVSDLTVQPLINGRLYVTLFKSKDFEKNIVCKSQNTMEECVYVTKYFRILFSVLYMDNQ